MTIQGTSSQTPPLSHPDQQIQPQLPKQYRHRPRSYSVLDVYYVPFTLFKEKVSKRKQTES